MALGRRRLVQYLTLAGVTGQALLRSGSVRAAVAEGQQAAGLAPAWPEMTYRTLGRTGFEASRLIFGCGATLMKRRHDDLLEAAFDAGVNVFDVGTGRYYDDAERNMAPFLKTHRDRIFLISKAMVYLDVEPDEPITVAQAREAARTWQGLMDESLRDLAVEHIDAYYLMGSNNPYVVASDELHETFLAAKRAGKVSHWGISTHQNAQKVLETAIDTGRFDLAMIAITPGGWYDWKDRNILPGSPSLVQLRPLLDRARAAGIGLIGMKAARFIAGRRFLGWGTPEAFDEYYDPRFLQAPLSPFQRSYAFVLEHGLDAVNADMQNFAHLKENFAAAATSHRYFV